MKKIYIAIIAAALLAVSNGLAQVQVLWVPGYTGGGGEFNVAPVIGSGYASSVLIGNGYETFCVSRSTGITIPGIYYQTVATNSVVQPDNKTMSKGTAWLYSQFAKGTLPGYRYAGAGIVNPDLNQNPNQLSDRANDAYSLQLAIWTLEGQYSYPDYTVNPYLVLAALNFGGLANAQGPNSPGGYNVGALNLNTVAGVNILGAPVQPMLTLITPPPPPTNCVPLPNCYTSICNQNRNGWNNWNQNCNGWNNNNNQNCFGGSNNYNQNCYSSNYSWR